MQRTKEELKEEQQKYYTRLNEILVKVQTSAITQRVAEDAIQSLNNEFDFLNSKASVCIIEAMTDEYVNFDENSTC